MIEPKYTDLLEALVGPDHREGFRGARWPEQPFSTPADREHLRLPEPLWTRGPRSWIEEFIGDRRVWFMGSDGIERLHRVDDPMLALALYDAGHTVMLAQLHDDPAFDCAWGRALAQALGQPEHEPPMAATLFLSPTGSGLEVHCDRNAFFVLQLLGRKRWHVGATVVPNPSRGWSPHRGTPMPPQLRAAGIDPDACMPAHAEDFELSVGDVLYVPAGAWHRTSAGCESMSLTLIPTVICWHTVLERVLARRLTANAPALAPATGLGGSELLRALGERRLSALLDELRETTASLTYEELVRELDPTHKHETNTA